MRTERNFSGCDDDGTDDLLDVLTINFEASGINAPEADEALTANGGGELLDLAAWVF